ncbi:kinase-like domain-containing protein [Cantharellus anzutake]|uniref:kinase-like domain-containing protein n=1 Tax=Cantharellus anzutake TaxID=1750568 RepID=UPI0019072661|nr:kinase-like domain-containing protein [Cantharellus anzutake]KAF8329818.1 kinase-like domain-containing protein [Cantharellus anzutake]
MNFVFLSNHSSNPLQVPSDDPINASFVERIRPAVEAEKLRAVQGLPPITSSDPTKTLTEERCISDDNLFAPHEGMRADPCDHGLVLANEIEEDVDDVQIQIPSDGEEGEPVILPRQAVLADSDSDEDPLLHRHPKDRKLGEYVLIDRLGEGWHVICLDWKCVMGSQFSSTTGTFSSVYKAIDLNHARYAEVPWLRDLQPLLPPRSKRYVAMKRIYVTSSPARIANELSILEDCRGCRNVSQLITAFRARDQVVVIMPYVKNVDFRDFYTRITIPGIQSYFRCLFRALRDIHARGIVHRDVKPANFLFDPDTGHGTLCDFGLAQRLESEVSSSCLHTSPKPSDPHGTHKHLRSIQVDRIKAKAMEARKRSQHPSERVGIPMDDTRPSVKANRAGTRGFRAPEVLLKCPDQSPALDIWSAGTILLSILACKFPVFQASDDIEALMELAAIFGRKTMEKCARLHNHAGVSWEDLVTKINPYLLQTPSSQTVPETVAKHNHFMKQAIDLLSKCLHWDATARTTAREALYEPFLHSNSKDDLDDDQQFPHPPGEGTCSRLHYLDEHNQHVVMIPVDDTKYITKVLRSGEGIAIGETKCEFHRDPHAVAFGEDA